MHDLEHRERRDAGGEPGEAHQRQADERARRPPPTTAASRSDRTLPVVVVRRKWARFGMIAGFSLAGTVRTPAVQAPIAKKAMCPNESTPELPTKR